MGLQISLLGTPEILVNDQPFDTDRRKAIALLAYLVVSGKPQPREQLAAFLWPDYERESAFAYLRRTLFELNQGLGKAWLATDRQSVGFQSSALARVDTQVFECELAAARLAGDPIPHLEAAAARYRGEFMAGFTLQDTEPFEDWLRLQRESYRREYATVLEQLTGICEQHAYWDAALKHALAWLRLDDFNEAAHRALMRIYAGMGDRSRAIRQYELCAQILKDQLGIKPLPETTELFERIRLGDSETVRSTVPPNHDAGRAGGLHLPVLTTPFIGRRTEIEQVKALLLNPDNRLLTMLGPGGIGKTRLSIQVASEIGDRFRDGAWFVPLATVQSADGIFPEVAKSLNFSFHPEENQENETPRQQLLEFLQGKQLLLILDNIDQLVSEGAAEQLIEILTGAEAIKLLVTSRERLNLPAEQVFPIPGMHVPTPAEVAAWRDPAAQATGFTAVKLFMDRARRIQPGFTLNQENAAAVAEICQLVDGMPLGIELAASWLELLPPEEIRAEIRRSLDFLETVQPGIPDRQHSIRAIFDYSWKLLNENERQVFLSLCVFIANFSREAAQQVSGASLRILLSLVNKSWLQQVEAGRFQLHPLLQHYGLELLRQDEQAWRKSHDRHAAYFAGFVAAQSLRMQGGEQLAALDDFSREFDTNVRSAWDWLVAAGRWAELRQSMLMGLFQFGMIRSRSDELIDWLSNARLEIEKISGSEERLIQAILEAVEIYFEEWWFASERRPIDRLVTLWQMVEDHHLAEPMGFWFVLLGKIFLTRNHAPWAESRIEAAIERIRDQGDAWTLGTTLLIQSYLFTQYPSGKLMENLDRNLQEALAIFRELGVVYEQGEIISIMAENALLQKHPLEDVVDLYQQAQQFSWKLNDLFGVATIYQDLGNLFFMRGRPADGFRAYHEARRIFEQIGRHYMVMGNLFWEGLWAIRYSTYEHALEIRQRLMDHRQYIRRDSVYFWNIYELGDVHRIYGYKKKALECYEEARTYFERINVVLGLGYCQRGMGDIAMQEGRYADARQHYQAFQAYAEQDNHMWSLAQASARLAWAEAHLGEIDQSRKDIFTCLNRLRRADEVAIELIALLSEARCLAAEGKIEPAVALAAFVLGHPITWKETGDLARSLLAVLAVNLDEGTFQAASRRMEGFDIRQVIAGWLADYETSVFV